MTFEELAATLPNGLHDAEVSRLQIDYSTRTVVLELSIWLGDDEDLEKYRSAQITLRGLQFCVMEGPDPRYPYAATEPLWISDVTSPPSGTTLPKPAAPNAFVSSFFVNQWNAFVHLAALDASLVWESE